MKKLRKPVKRSIIGGGLAAVLVAGMQVALLATPASAAVTFNVTTTADIAANAGACGNTTLKAPSNPANLSLREAVCLANNNGGTATINIPNGTYTLTNGEAAVGTHSGQNVTLSGAGSATTIISGNNAHRVLDFDPDIVGGVAGTVSGLTITGGNDSSFGGAGIIGGSSLASTPDTLAVTNSVITSNAANTTSPNSTVVPGGGIQFIGGSLTISNSTISNNSSKSSPGAGVYYGAQGQASPESLTITGTTFSGNTMTNTSGSVGTNNGGALYVHGGTTTQMQVSDSTFTGNTVTATTGGADGGAIRQDNGVLTVSESTFTGNSATGGDTTASGGAIDVVNGTTTLHYNRFVGNVATSGQALYTEPGADTFDASENWFGCNGGPGAIGCDTVTTTSPGGIGLSPRLVFSASAGSSTLTGPNATTSITGSFTTDSSSAAVSGANLSAFNGKSVSFTDPQPTDATVASPTAAFGADTGTSSDTYNSQDTSGPGHVVVGFDNASVTVPLTVNQAPAVTTNPTNTTVTAGDTATFTAAASGYPTPTVQWQVSTNGGTSYSNIAGATSTTYSFTAAQGDNGNKYRAVFTNSVTSTTTTAATLTVGAPPSFTSGTTATFKVGTAGPTFTITTSGTPAVTSISKSGALPSGLMFTDNGDGTATISGTPATGTGGTYPITLTATNGVAPDATQNLSVQVNQAPAITTNPSDQTVNPGTSVTFTAAASGVPTPTVQWQVSTNGGASYSNIGGATSTSYTFTAAAGDNGNMYRAVFTNTVNTATTTAATLSVGTAPAFTSSNTTTFTVGTAGSFAITTSGVPNATISKIGTTPAWLALTDNSDGTGSLTGTPPVGSGGTYTFTLHASNGFNPSASQSFTLKVNEAPTITSTNHATFTVGSAGSFAVTTSAGYPTTTAVTETGALPSGVTLTDNHDGTATLAGTPAAGTSGSYPITIHANATGGTTSPRDQSFTLTVNGPPLITSADHTTFTVGTAGSFTVTTSAGNPTTTTITETGTLPSGVTFLDNGNGTATLSGTPAAGTGGNYALTFTASNGVSPNSIQTFTLTVNQPPTITSANHATFTRGVSSSFTVTTAAGRPTSTTLSETGALPGGVTFTDNGDGTATLGGTPTASGSFPLTIKASNGVAPDASQGFTLTVNGPPTITSADHSTFTVGSNGTFTVTTTAGTPAARTITETGALPSGVTFLDNGNGTATLAGTPAAGTGGSYPITFTASNGVSPNSIQTFTLTVDEPSTITSADHVTFTKNASSSFTVTTSGGFPTPPAISESGTLPPGTTFVDNGNGTATLAGTPTTDGAYPFTITASNGVAPNATQSFTATVNGGPTITSANHTTFTVGTPGTFTVTTTAGTPATTTLSKTGALPSGVTFLDNGNGTATLAGTPAAGTGGSYPITFTASNGVSPNPTQTFTLTVDEPSTITSADHVTFTKNASSSFTVTTSGGFPTPPAISESGTLPPGTTFVDNGNGTATLAGTPTTDGAYPFTITASNGVAPNATQSFTATVNGGPTITSANHTTFTVGTPGTFTVTTTAGTPATTTLSKSGALPSGVTFLDNGNGTATLAGTPAAGTGGSYPITITASNTSANSTQSFTLTVDQAPKITTADHVTFKVGTFSTFGVGTTGYPAPALSKVGALPAGVTFVDDGTGTATLSGTPAAGQGGTYSLTITATNGVAPNATQSFTLTVNDPPKITSADHTTFAVGTAGTFTVTTTAGTPATTTLAKTGTLPSGVTFVDHGNGTATLAGTPGIGTGGSYPLTITASNGVTPDATQSFTLTVTELPAITSADHTTFTVGTSGSFGVTTTAGYPTATTLTATGALPGGVTFVDNGDGTATLAGTPAAGAGGSYPITITATNTAGHTDQSFTLTVREAPGITSANHATFTVATAGTFTVTTGAAFPTPPTLAETGTLPGGVTFVDNGDGTATLAGTPAAGTGGQYPITITASNGVNPDDTQSFTLTIDQAPAITSADHTTFTIGSNGSFAITTTGYPDSAVTEVGSLPNGVTFVDNGDGTATLAGIPAAGTNGSYPLAITASNGVNPAAVQSFTLTVTKAAQAITITSTPPANPVVNGPGYTITATADSGLTVDFTIDGATTNSACSISGATVTFDHAGSCVIDANQGGDSTYQPAPQVQQTLTVSAIGTAVSVVSSTSPTVYGQAAHATATVTADSGTPAGSVQFTVDGNNLGAAVTVSGGQAVSADLTDSSGNPLAPGSHPVVATFTPSDTTTYAGSSNSVTQVVDKADTTTMVSVHSTTITATVAAVAPGAGTPTGSVDFSVGGSSVGNANLVNGVATLHYTVPAGMTRQVGAAYGGDADFSGSSDSTARHDPTIRAHVTSTHHKTRFGWYRGTVTITFTCTTNGAPLTKPCPSAVHLTHNGAGQSVTRTITATDGGMDTIVVSNINIDHTKPHVRVAGVKNGATYDTAPKLKCVARDALSGIAKCKLTRHTSGSTTTYRATATDKAGNKRTVTGKYHSQAISIEGAKLVDGAYNVKLGHTYTIVVHSIKRPTYYDAAPVPTTPFKRDQVFQAAGHHRWALGVTIEQRLHHYKYWNLGVKIGKTMHVIRIRVS